MIGADILEKIKGIAISRRDRNLIYSTLAFFAAGISYLVVFGKDTKLHQDALSNMIWAAVVLVILFVAGTVEQRRIAARTVKPEEPKV